MKKRIVMYMVLGMLTAGCLYGCGKKAADVETTTQTEASDVAETTDDTETTAIPNPMVEYDTLDELEKAVGFSALVLPESSGYTLNQIFGIDNLTADLRYTGKNDPTSEISVRTAIGADVGMDDISGYMTDDWTEETINDVTVYTTQMDVEGESSLAAYWQVDKFVYSMDLNSGDTDLFHSELSELVALSAQ